MMGSKRLIGPAEALREAESSGKPIPPLSETIPALAVADAYEIQRLNVQHRIQEGARSVGRKVGLTSAAMQEMLGVGEPDYGSILDDMLVDSGDRIEFDDLLQPRIEAEIAFVLGRDLEGPGVGTAHVLRATAGVAASLEVIDSRIEDWRITLVDTIADNASSARVVLGPRIVPIDDLDLRLAGVVVSRNGASGEIGTGAAALGHPARCVAWLANKLAEFGEILHAGDIVMPGALHRALPVEPGDSFTAEFAWLGSVSVAFSAGGGHE